MNNPNVVFLQQYTVLYTVYIQYLQSASQYIFRDHKKSVKNRTKTRVEYC